MDQDREYLRVAGWQQVMTAEDGCETWSYPWPRRKDWPDWVKEKHGTQHYWDLDEAVELQRKIGDMDQEHIMQFFAYEHLPPHLQAVSKPFGELAAVVMTLPRNPERSVALRKLLEAKDAAVRASLAK